MKKTIHINLTIKDTGTVFENVQIKNNNNTL